jgi:hypothetical protein
VKLYCVLLNGEGFELSLNGGALKKFGFFRNIYVLASDVDDAKTKARLFQISDINRRPDLVGLRSLTADDLEVDSVEVSYEVWKLIFREGFAFYPTDESHGGD